MKIKQIGFTILALGLVGFAVFLMKNSEAVRAGRPVPTPAPTQTKGPPVEAKSVVVSLAKPLTREQAFDRVLEYDRRIAVWKKTWSQETLRIEPNRIQIQWYADRTYDGSEFGPSAERGPLWVITIRGPVHLIYDDPPNVYHDGISYEIAEQTGNILGFTTGAWVKE